MKRLLLLLPTVFLLSMLMSCGDSDTSGNTAQPTATLVTVTVGPDATPAKPSSTALGERHAAAAAEVTYVIFTVSAPGMETITRTVSVSGLSSITETFSVPSGRGVSIVVEGRDASGRLHLRGESGPLDLAGTPVSVGVAMTLLAYVAPVEGTTPQSAAITTGFPRPLSVKVTDAGGIPFGDTAVTFEIMPAANGASGTFDGSPSATVTTDAAGMATAPPLAANGTAGSFLVVATATNSRPATFVLMNYAALRIVGTAGFDQVGVIGTEYRRPLQVTVTDGAALPVSFAEVTFWGIGRFPDGSSSVKVLTDERGVATAPPFKANSSVGWAEVGARVNYPGEEVKAKLPAFNSTPTIAATAGTLQSAQISTQYHNQLKATVADSWNNRLPNISVTFTVNPGASGQGAYFPGGAVEATVLTDESGIATAPPITANGITGSYTVTAAMDIGQVDFTLTNFKVWPLFIRGSISSNLYSPPYLHVVDSKLVARVTDERWQPVPDIKVVFNSPSGTFAVPDPREYPSHVSGPVTYTTDTDGYATVTFHDKWFGGFDGVTATIAGTDRSATFPKPPWPDEWNPPAWCWDQPWSPFCWFYW